MKILFKTHNLGISMSYDHVLKLLPNGFSFHYLYCLIKIVLFFFLVKHVSITAYKFYIYYVYNLYCIYFLFLLEIFSS